MVRSGRGPGRLASPATANVLACFAVVVVAAAIWLGALVPGRDLGQNILSLITFITLGAVGVVVARAQPRNPVGWLLLAARSPSPSVARAETTRSWSTGSATAPCHSARWRSCSTCSGRRGS